MRVLAIEPYYGGSHRAFLDGWMARSGHKWDILSLPAYKWKWRMRHSAFTFARQAEELFSKGLRWDVLFCSDMLNLAEFRGLCHGDIGSLAAVVYFHENQVTYPVRFESERDYQFGFTNMTTALSADEVWFNSGFHRNEFLGGLKRFLGRMPDNNGFEAIEEIGGKSKVYWPGVGEILEGSRSRGRAMSILWACRWEHDKNPEDFFAALKILKDRGVDFRLNVIGESFRQEPKVFGWAKDYFAKHIDRWGYRQSRSDYQATLCESDVVVSTANHEFFGISVVEAILAGAYPMLPERLAYPEILSLGKNEGVESFFYDGSVRGLADRLGFLAEVFGDDAGWAKAVNKARGLVDGLRWGEAAGRFDLGLERVCRRR